jgi:hypothetical protein
VGKDYRLCKTELTEGFGSLGLDIDLSVIEDHFDKFDKNEDGLIDFDEFFGLFQARVDARTKAGVDTRQLQMRAKCVLRTDEWVEAVTKYKSAELVEKIFSPDSILLGTISRTIRSRDQGGDLGIKEYFEYFAKLPDSQVVRRTDTIAQITDTVFVNNSMVYWAWTGGPTVEDPLCARMTFIYRLNDSQEDVELFQLHSSALPAPKID